MSKASVAAWRMYREYEPSVRALGLEPHDRKRLLREMVGASLLNGEDAAQAVIAKVVGEVRASKVSENIGREIAGFRPLPLETAG